MQDCGLPVHYASADEPALQDRLWLGQQWDIARLKLSDKHPSAVLVIDEIQKITNWSETVKRLWDEDTATQTHLKVILLGSSPLLMQKGLTESLAGRFEIVPITHWSFSEMRDCFGLSLEQYIYFGGYPGSMELIETPLRWAKYISDSLIETTLSRDILLMTRVDKPALLRRLFQIGCTYSGQILSYQKMIGQLQDAGNTTTLSHYLTLLSSAGLLTGIEKYSGQTIRKRGSSPKLMVFNTALMSAASGVLFKDALINRTYWGGLVESAVGSYLLNESIGKEINVYYWLHKNQEVDFVLESGKTLVAVEVKSGAKQGTLDGMECFTKTFAVNRRLLVGGTGIAVEEFLSTPIEHWIR